MKDTATRLLDHHSLNFNNNNTSLYHCLVFSFNLPPSPHEDPTLCQTHQFTHSLPGRISIISTLFPQSLLLSLSLSPFHTLPHSLQHMPTHAAAQAHVIWNCIFPSFSLLSLPHTTLSLSPLYLSLTCIHVRVPRGPDSHLN